MTTPSTVTALQPTHPLHDTVNALAERLIQFQASADGRSYLRSAPPYPIRASLSSYLVSLHDKNIHAADYCRSSMQEVIEILCSPKELEALEDTRAVSFTASDFIILNRTRLHLTTEQTHLLIALFSICRTDRDDLVTVH